MVRLKVQFLGCTVQLLLFMCSNVYFIFIENSNTDSLKYRLRILNLLCTTKHVRINIVNIHYKNITKSGNTTCNSTDCSALGFTRW